MSRSQRIEYVQKERFCRGICLLRRLIDTVYRSDRDLIGESIRETCFSTCLPLRKRPEDSRV